MRSLYLFAAFALLHVGGVLFAPEPLAPLMAGSIYLPLTLLKVMGLPVYASVEGWGWAAPSPFGWAAVVVLWGLIWWLVARIATRLYCHIHGRFHGRFGPT